MIRRQPNSTLTATLLPSTTLFRSRYPRLSAVRMNATPFDSGTAWWSEDSQTAYFVDVERGEQKAHVVAFDVASGATRIVFSEESASYVELGVNVYTKALITPLPKTGELIWSSERRSEEHTSELQSLMRISYAVFCLKKKRR